MGIFDRRKENDKESPLWKNAYIPSYNYQSDSNGNAAASFALNEGIATRLLKKPKEFYEDTDRFLLLLISSTDKKILGTLPYDKALKLLDPYKLEETKEEVIIRPLTYSELSSLLKG
ncbi:MAG TPA: hypothetical protein DEG74_05285 [Clostridiales bacterium]|jgi:hypothetical protein|nr:hypothetical protein [Saccharofermentanaceae bacterium]HAU50772.1 hypothetical protein [Clostridiales bacterium]HBY33158.1 hypothetical protein [Clostridiales bacterium]HBZ77363.1 hypothetical protein [Clostridiales bacterium]